MDNARASIATCASTAITSKMDVGRRTSPELVARLHSIAVSFRHLPLSVEIIQK